MASNRLKAEKEAKTYLEMRGFKLLELNWGLSKNKIDVIAQKDDKVCFIEINQIDTTSAVPIFTKSMADKFKMAAEAWADQNKYTGQYSFCSIELSKPSYTVIAFNQDILL